LSALIAESKYSDADTVDLALVFRNIASIIERSMGGTSGAIYAIFFNAVSNSISASSFKVTKDSSMSQTLAQVLQYGLAELCKYTSARKGHRTLMDALIPFVDTFAETRDLGQARKAALEGAESTKVMAALLGRASYVAKEQFDCEGGIPDPGALGVVSVIKGILAGLSNESA
jgi:triose/dihydroxyacetone kinase / FAD-AMP lyase (cyclizing)